MNDSPYGLTASVWTNVDGNPTSQAAFTMFVEALETGTVFLNRWVGSSIRLFLEFNVATSCDYLDPALAWCGVKDSGRGVSLSKFGLFLWFFYQWTINDCPQVMINSRDQSLCIWRLKYPRFYLWCTRLSHRYFCCTKKFWGRKKNLFFLSVW